MLLAFSAAQTTVVRLVQEHILKTKLEQKSYSHSG